MQHQCRGHHTASGNLSVHENLNVRENLNECGNLSVLGNLKGPENTHENESERESVRLHDTAKLLPQDLEWTEIESLRHRVVLHHLSVTAMEITSEHRQQVPRIVGTLLLLCHRQLVPRTLPHMHLLSHATTTIQFLLRQLALEVVVAVDSVMMHHLDADQHIGEDEAVVISPAGRHLDHAAREAVQLLLLPHSVGLLIVLPLHILELNVSAII